MENQITTDIRQNDWNIDRALIFLTPLALISVLIWMPDEWLFQSSLLCFGIFGYILMIYKYRLIYGFSGIRILSIPSTIIATYTVFISVPSIYILMINDHQNENAYFYSILLFYILYPMGLFLGQSYRKIELDKIPGIFTGGLKKDKNDKLFYEIILILFSVSLLIAIGYLLRVNEIPLIELIKNPGGNAKFALLREDALKTLHMTKIERYLFFWLRTLFIPFGIIGSLFLNSNYSKNKYKILLVAFFVFGLLVNTITLEKSPIASIFLSIAAYVFLKKDKIKVSMIVTLISVSLAGPIIISYFLFVDRADVYEIILWTYINRLLVTPAEVLFYYFQYFPETHEFLLGKSSQLFSWMHADGTFPVANYVAKLWWKTPATTGSANAIYLGNYWSDFGWYGTITSTLIFGFITHLLQWKILETTEYEKNILYIITMSICIPIFTFGFFSSNFTILFFTKGLLLLIFFLHGYDYWQKHRRLKSS